MKSIVCAAFLMSGTAAIADPCVAPLPKPGTHFSGPVRYVGDGDSICIGTSRDPGTWIEIRVADFYAPELHSPGGKQAKAAMVRIAMGKMLECEAGKRSYDRVIGKCTLSGKSIGDLMREAGIAEGGRGR